MTTGIRLDEGEDQSWVVIQGRAAKVEGADFMIDSPDRRAGKGGSVRRALVHDSEDSLTMNFGNDYTGGVTINSARLNLRSVPQADDKLPIHGTVGDLVMMRSTQSIGGNVVSDSCSLWLCVPGGMGRAAPGALWSRVTLGEPIVGSA